MRIVRHLVPIALLGTTGITCAAQPYTATSLQPVGSSVGFANIIGLNNKGQVLGDACNIVGGFLHCYGTDRFPAVWDNGVITPLPIPDGYSYIAQPSYYGINDSGTVVGTLDAPGGGKVVVWKGGLPEVLPDAPIPGACSGLGCTCSPVPFGNPVRQVVSTSFGINAAKHIVGSTTYPSYTPGGPSCSGSWVYDGASFHLLPYPQPAQCPAHTTNVYLPPAFNDADQVLETVQNVFCGPPFHTVSPPYPGADPAVIQPSGSFSFLPVGTLAAASGTSINDVGDVLGYWSNGGGTADLLVWDNNGLHDFGPSGYGHMNQAGQVVYLTTSGIAVWQNGISSPVSLPANMNPASIAYVPTALSDTGQFVASEGTVAHYLLTPSGPCAQDVTSQVQITRTGFRYNHSTGLFALIGSVTNTSGAPIPGPISLVVDNLSTNASLLGISGDTLCATPQGSPYINIGNIGAGQDFAPGASISGSIDFIDTAKTGITYNLRVLAGPAVR